MNFPKISFFFSIYFIQKKKMMQNDENTGKIKGLSAISCAHR